MLSSESNHFSGSNITPRKLDIFTSKRSIRNVFDELKS